MGVEPIETEDTVDVPQIVVSFLVGSLGAGIASAVIKKRFDTAFRVSGSQRAWKEPACAQLARTHAAFKRWSRQNPYLEASVVRAGNVAVRDLLPEKPHLIPPELRQHATSLVVHYDVWLEEFDRWRGDRDASADDGPAFVFAGPKGYPFPREAESAFTSAYEQYWSDLYTGL